MVSSKDTMDIHRSKTRFKRLLQQIESWSIPECDRSLILSFLKRRELEGMSYRQLLRYVDSLKRFIRIVITPSQTTQTTQTTLNPSFKNVEEKDIENFLLSMEGLKPYTKQKGWYCIKKFFEYIGRKDLFDNFKIRFKAAKLRPKEEIWTKEEMEKLIDAADSLRDKAFITVMTEGGYRIGEILTAKIKNIELSDYGCKIIVEGKTGWRNPLLIKSATLLKEFIKNKNKEQLIFDFSYNQALGLMKRLGKRAGVAKCINQQIIRSSAATRDASWLTDSQLCLKYGWRQGSKTSRIYVRMSGRDLDFAILKMNGIELTEEMEKMRRMGIG